ncbi:DUF1906 domain-containing protein [Kitasatospora sp. NPDC093806]|uniref:DUF1906 domain-containing protein n=1 Tax=Kitasatospora sp. NPDC093806 TaxID=3155075 RepID=UPI003448C08B
MFGSTSAPQRWRGAAAVLAAAALVGGAAGAAQAAPAGDPVKNVSYLGHTFSVPESWPVVDLTADPTACVRLDRHAVYLGTPGSEQNCPAGLIGRTETLLVEPFEAAATAAGTSVSVMDHEVVATASGIRATGTYDTDQALVRRILAGAKLPTAAPKADGKKAQAPSAKAQGAPSAGETFAQAPAALAAGNTAASDLTNHIGQGFDACAAPDNAAMDAWLSSPYRAVGIYIGGSKRACRQDNLNAAWVQRQANNGWRFLPIYVGVQAAGINWAEGDGWAAAEDAANQAVSLGIGPGAVLYYDMESYDVAAYSAKVQPFLSAWTARLHERGYNSAVYSSSATGIADLVANQSSGYAMPDALFTANWNGKADTNDPKIPANLWNNHQRAHQYKGNVEETWGGRKINIDQDYLDVQLQARVPGRSLVGVYRPTTQQFALADANGNLLGSAVFGSPGDTPLTGDWNGDTKDTLGVYRSSNSTFYLTNDQSSVAIARTFGMRGDIPVVGDWDGNGTDTIGVFRPSDSAFYLSNNNSTVAYRVEMGMGGDLPIVGDWNGDGKTTVGIYRPSTQTFVMSDSSTAGQVDHLVTFGDWWDTPIVGDWDGDGTDQVGVYRPSDSGFYGAAKDSGALVYSVKFGSAGDAPVVGRW